MLKTIKIVFWLAVTYLLYVTGYKMIALTLPFSFSDNFTKEVVIILLFLISLLAIMFLHFKKTFSQFLIFFLYILIGVVLMLSVETFRDWYQGNVTLTIAILATVISVGIQVTTLLWILSYAKSKLLNNK